MYRDTALRRDTYRTKLDKRKRKDANDRFDTIFGENVDNVDNNLWILTAFIGSTQPPVGYILGKTFVRSAAWGETEDTLARRRSTTIRIAPPLLGYLQRCKRSFEKSDECLFSLVFWVVGLGLPQG